MKRLIVAIALLLTSVLTGAQTMKSGDMNVNTREIEDKVRLRELVDTFSILADKKEARKQTELFTEDATVETYSNGALVSKLRGREEIGNAFANFLKNFDIVYHFNGQPLASIQGDHATGNLYCLTYLFGKENGKRVKTSIGVRYNDEYVGEKGKWLISKRTSFFEWQEKDDRP
jgi:SnoaL-like domain